VTTIDRPLIYSAEQGRSFDFASLAKYDMLAQAWQMQDLLGQSITVVGGVAATSVNTLAISFSAGRIYQLAAADATAYAGGVLLQDNTQILQQGWAPAQSFTLTTAGLAAGQSRWVLIEAGFSQADAIAANDPNNGILPYFNATNPLVPQIGPGGSGQAQPTVRQGLCVVKPVYGNPATTGSEAPPQPDSGYVPLYLIDLSYGQTSISQGQIFVAGPSVGSGVPSNYPIAPFLAGLLNSHHGGTPGQAPKINLATEVQGLLPPANLQDVRVQITQNTTFYVNSAGGSDSNPGTSGAPWATLQKADSYLRTIDLNGYVVTINISGTFSSGLVIDGPYAGSRGATSVIYNFQSGSSITCNTNCFLATDGAGVTVQGPVTLATTVAGPGLGNCLYATSAAHILCAGGIIFASAASYHFGLDLGGIISVSAGYGITGGALGHINTPRSSSFSFNDGTNYTITITGTPNFSLAFVQTQFGSIYIPSNLVNFSGSATGVKYTGILNGVININNGGPNYLPGSAAGTVSSGAQIF
jgi:hypothetical protein